MKKYTPAMQNLNLGRHEKKTPSWLLATLCFLHFLNILVLLPVAFVFFIYPKEQPWVFRKSFPQEPSKPSKCKENEGNGAAPCIGVYSCHDGVCSFHHGT